MILGTGCDIVKVDRFAGWVSRPELLKRFFSSKELYEADEKKHAYSHRQLEHYAVRFAAKEAFSKALGTGLRGFALSEVSVIKDELGKPELFLEGNALSVLEKRCGKNCRVHLTLSHEKEYAMAYVIIEGES